jgi:hypothetical protein
MDAMVMVRTTTLTICRVLNNKKGGGFNGYDENTTIKSRYIILGARFCWITQGGWGDWQRKAKGAGNGQHDMMGRGLGMAWDERVADNVRQNGGKRREAIRRRTTP